MNTKKPDPNCPLCFGKGVRQRTDMLEPCACECCERKPAAPLPEQKSETPELKPCPFCRGTRIIKGERYFAMCVDCGATGPERIGDKAGIKKLFADWNTRYEPESDTLREQLEVAAAKISNLSTRMSAGNHLQKLTEDNVHAWMNRHTEAQSKLTALTAEVERLKEKPATRITRTFSWQDWW